MDKDGLWMRACFLSNNLKIKKTSLNSADRLNKFLDRVNELIMTLTQEKNSLLQQGVDPYYYIQKREELKLLQEGVANALKKIAEEKERLHFFNEKLDEGYKELFDAWRKDARWVNNVMRERQPKANQEKATTNS
jgi:hypothetical protein